MAKLFVPVGIPGCGKSSLHNQLLEGAVVSSDAIRRKICPDGYDASRNDEVFYTYYSEIERLLLNDIDVFADATNLEAESRRRLAEIAQRCDAELHVILFTNVQQAVQRNSLRPEKAEHGGMQVPAEVMRDKMIPRYEETLLVIDQEPHDSLTRIVGVD